MISGRGAESARVGASDASSILALHAIDAIDAISAIAVSFCRSVPPEFLRSFLAPTGALIVIVCYYTSAATF